MDDLAASLASILIPGSKHGTVYAIQEQLLADTLASSPRPTTVLELLSALEWVAITRGLGIGLVMELRQRVYTSGSKTLEQFVREHATS
ncbi:MAG: hypothetical protein H6834_13370 [Planctomycetes bacterium]|nr:hypothetical protein [Planctomycetota bacterium]MCB9890974.1 hypothetical protein [Planctomycetota bacterium]